MSNTKESTSIYGANIFIGIILVLMIITMYYAFKDGLAKTEMSECVYWEKQYHVNRLFYNTDAEIEQCRRYGIDLGISL